MRREDVSSRKLKQLALSCTSLDRLMSQDKCAKLQRTVQIVQHVASEWLMPT